MIINILKNKNLKEILNYKIGGEAKYFIEANTEEDVVEAVKWAKENGRFFILGGGTNVLFDDRLFNGTVIKIALKGLKKEEDEITACSGVLMSELLDFCFKNGLSGLEWAGGLPGTVGGAIRGNAGAFGGEIKDSILKIESLDFTGDKPELKIRDNKDCLFGYRDSIFKNNGEIILKAVLKFSPGNGPASGGKNKDKKGMEREIKKHILYRKEHQPLEYPSAGSVFKNIPLDSVAKEVREEFKAAVKTDPFPIIPAAAVLNKLGLKGKEMGGAEISAKHPNFIVNKNNASFGDVIGLIDLAKEEAFQKYKISLKEEIEIVEFQSAS